jgi:hypothetical protein
VHQQHIPSYGDRRGANVLVACDETGFALLLLYCNKVAGVRYVFIMLVKHSKHQLQCTLLAKLSGGWRVEVSQCPVMNAAGHNTVY